MQAHTIAMAMTNSNSTTKVHNFFIERVHISYLTIIGLVIFVAFAKNFDSSISFRFD